jgi:UDP-N-acetylmuramyl pentapeptide phosphotransferase/UDP-N-acetylglucosamine-1-phosphate transferase
LNPTGFLSALWVLLSTLPVAPLAWGLGVSAGTALLLVVTKRWHQRFSVDSHHGVQKFHTAPTPRIGGIALALGAVALVLSIDTASFDFAFDALHGPDASARLILKSVCLAALPALVAGLAEDVTKRVSVMLRLAATMASGLLAWWLTGQALGFANVPLLGWALQWLPLSVAFTAFAVAGVANAFNIIDGFHGLAAFTALWVLVGLAGLAQWHGDTALAAACLGLAAVVVGFLLINWPWGKIFMGDGGAYFLGFAMAWLAVLLVERNPAVSPFALLLLCLHPINETLFSVARRFARRQHAGQPDRQHLHSLVKRRYMVRWLPDSPPWLRNAATGLLVSCLTLPALPLAWATHHSHALSLLACLVLVGVYLAVYARIVRHRWVMPLCLLRQPSTSQAKLRRVRGQFLLSLP